MPLARLEVLILMFFRCPITSTPGHSVNRNRYEDSGSLLVVHHTDRLVLADSALLQLLNQASHLCDCQSVLNATSPAKGRGGRAVKERGGRRGQ